MANQKVFFPLISQGNICKQGLSKETADTTQSLEIYKSQCLFLDSLQNMSPIEERWTKRGMQVAETIKDKIK